MSRDSLRAASRLGKGAAGGTSTVSSISALFAAPDTDYPIITPDIANIEDNPHQPRSSMDEEAYKVLRASIQEYGLQQPIGVLQLNPMRFRLVYGSRRLRAMREIGNATIPCRVVANLDGASAEKVEEISARADEIALFENLHRDDLDVFDEAEAIRGLKERHGLRYNKIAPMIGKTTTAISRILSVLRLPDIIRHEATALKPARYRLFDIAAVDDEAQQMDLWQALKAEMTGAPRPGTPGRADERDNEADEPGAPRERRNRVAIPSLLPQRYARHIHHAHEVLAGLRAEPRPLGEEDRRRLEDMREAIDAILRTAS
ncbi:ParB/RepB/Spo0J family partition protein [Azospirillum sp.]|uniref:ParB/RepB/Spo0J family partition protein n=1 Tax=Azospirillum sp. TaxID=34012 RepID=UPI003D70751B